MSQKQGKKQKVSAELVDKIRERMTPEIARAVIDACDMIIRLRMGQLTSVCETLRKYCGLYQEGRGVNLDEPLYRAIELGEYILCAIDKPGCKDAKTCWITRKGFCPERTKNVRNKNAV